uniref:LysM domain-containing protein n=1 Tax=Fagus sylvatica TaxID=28930 RepID=A0A2N9GVP2_FAGSY
MAKRNNKSATFLNLILVLSLLLIISITECRQLGTLGFGFGEDKSTIPVCKSVYGVQAGDTCSSIVQNFSLNAEFFGAINPNLNCDRIFAGQWLCINGTVNQVAGKIHAQAINEIKVSNKENEV